MHQPVDPRHFTAKAIEPKYKRHVGPNDLEVVADLLWEEIRSGLYTDIISARTRSEIVYFLRRLATKCEFQQYDPAKKCFRTRAAALLVYATEESVVGFSVLAESVTGSARNCVELVMLGIVPLQRGLGHGAAVLDSLIKAMSQHYFTLIVRCPSDNQLLFAMLVTRGFVSIGRECKDRLLRLVPLFMLARGAGEPGHSRRVE